MSEDEEAVAASVGDDYASGSTLPQNPVAAAEEIRWYAQKRRMVCELYLHSEWHRREADICAAIEALYRRAETDKAVRDFIEKNGGLS